MRLAFDYLLELGKWDINPELGFQLIKFGCLIPLESVDLMFESHVLLSEILQGDLFLSQALEILILRVEVLGVI